MSTLIGLLVLAPLLGSGVLLTGGRRHELGGTFYQPTVISGISEESVACAIENQELNAIGNTAFFAGNVGEVLADLRTRAGDPDVVVVDPPRAGLAGKALKRLGEIAAPRIVYVSCNPTTLAPNAAELVQAGWTLERVRPVDMFPQTHHIECVARFERR